MNRFDSLQIVLKDEDRKSLPRILLELAHCTILERELPYYYFASYLHKKEAPDYRNFIGFKKVKAIEKYVHYKGNRGLLNKKEFERILSEYGIPTPAILATTHEHVISSKGESTELHDEVDLKNILSKLIKKSPSKSIFIKTDEGYGGFHSFKFNFDTVSDLFEIEKLFNLLSNTDFLVQETVIQDDTIDRIYPHSLNTIRVLVYKDPRQESVEILGAYMRFGSGGMIIDNSSSGGIAVPVDVSSWILQKNGVVLFRYGGKQYDAHPDTGFKFEGFVIPFGDEIRNIVCQVALLFDNSYVGWDVAITNNGPIIIEGNQNPHVVMAQYACKGLKNHPGYKKVYKGYC